MKHNFLFTLATILAVSIAISSFALTNTSTMTDGTDDCEYLDDLELQPLDDNDWVPEGIVTMSTCGPVMVGYLLFFEYDWINYQPVYHCVYTGHFYDRCFLFQTTGYDD